MAIKKISNQITITEHKKIKQIKEWYLATSQESGVTRESSGWTTEVQSIDASNNYLWNYEEVVYSLGEPELSEPIIIGHYAGISDVRGIVDITNEYLLTETTELPDSPEWSNDSSVAAGLTPIKKYLWNREIITYTSGDPTYTTPAIIGVYGDSGTGAVDFQIYSVDGFEFSDEVSSITLQTVAFQGGSSIESEATYQWKYWNADSTLEDKYEDITDAISSNLTVVPTDSYAFVGLKCEMTYDGIIYSDFVMLTKKDTIYTSVIKFMGGSNIFDSSSSYLLAYVELYKGSKLEDTIYADKIYNGNNNIIYDTIKSIRSDFDDVDNKKDVMYFLTKCDHTTIGDDHYIAVLGQFNRWIYDEEDTSLIVGSYWNVLSGSSDKYIYTNNIYTDVATNVIVISREDVSTTKELAIEVRDKSTKAILSTTNATIVDLKDPIISDEKPMNVKDGQLWLDTSVNPYELKIYVENIELQYVLNEPGSHNLSDKQKTEDTITYLYADADAVILCDDGRVMLDASSNTVKISYKNYENAEVLKGKYYQKYTEDLSSTVYYMSNESTISTSIDSYTIPSYGNVTIYYVRSSHSHVVSSQTIRNGKWKYFSQQNGGAVYTSIPLNGYSDGDLWIINDSDISGYQDMCPNLFDKFGSGTMLKANTSSDSFNENHWDDAQSETTSIIQNVKQYFEFNSDSGMKIGRKDEKFYVNIDSERMSFFDNTGDIPQEVVYISNSTANIDNVLIEGSAEFDCNATFNGDIEINGSTSNNTTVGFIWKIESNGSLSLAISS